MYISFSSTSFEMIKRLSYTYHYLLVAQGLVIVVYHPLCVILFINKLSCYLNCAYDVLYSHLVSCIVVWIIIISHTENLIYKSQATIDPVLALQQISRKNVHYFYRYFCCCCICCHSKLSKRVHMCWLVWLWQSTWWNHQDVDGCCHYSGLLLW